MRWTYRTRGDDRAFSERGRSASKSSTGRRPTKLTTLVLVVYNLNRIILYIHNPRGHIRSIWQNVSHSEFLLCKSKSLAQCIAYADWVCVNAFARGATRNLPPEKLYDAKGAKAMMTPQPPGIPTAKDASYHVCECVASAQSQTHTHTTHPPSRLWWQSWRPRGCVCVFVLILGCVDWRLLRFLVDASKARAQSEPAQRY